MANKVERIAAELTRMKFSQPAREKCDCHRSVWKLPTVCDWSSWLVRQNEGGWGGVG